MPQFPFFRIQILGMNREFTIAIKAQTPRKLLLPHYIIVGGLQPTNPGNLPNVMF